MKALLTSVKPRLRTPSVATLVVATLLLSATMAAAADPEGEDTGEVIDGDGGVTEVAEDAGPASPLEFFPDPGAVVFSLPDEEGMHVDCSAAILTVQLDGTITAEPPECLAVPAVGPAGQVNHGQVVKAYVHGLKDSGYEGPRGQLVREAARSDFGKGDQQVKPEPTAGDDEESGEAGIESTAKDREPRGKAKGHGRR